MLSITRMNNFQTINRNNKMQKSNHMQASFGANRQELETQAMDIVGGMLSLKPEKGSPDIHKEIKQLQSNGGNVKHVIGAIFDYLSGTTAVLADALDKQAEHFRLSGEHKETPKLQDADTELIALSLHIERTKKKLLSGIKD